jgi:hypothetical protein
MRLLALFTVLVAAGLTVHIGLMHAASQREAQRTPLVLDVGDSFRVAGGQVGCQVVLREGTKTIDCRLAGALTGSYGTLMTATRVLVVRFRNAHLAKEVFSATQHGSSGSCR